MSALAALLLGAALAAPARAGAPSSEPALALAGTRSSEPAPTGDGSPVEDGAPPASADSPDPEPSTGRWRLAGPGRVATLRPAPVSLHPDAFQAGYGFIVADDLEGRTGPRWAGTVGGRVFLVGADGPGAPGLRAGPLSPASPPTGFRLSLDAFLQTYNARVRYPVPWELYRSHLGVQVQGWRDVSRGDTAHRVDVGLGFYHESDHTAAPVLLTRWYDVSDEDDIIDVNTNGSSFEFVQAWGRWQASRGPLHGLVTVGLRAFTPSVNPRSLRQPGAAGWVEAQLHRVIRGRTTGYGGLLVEVTGYSDRTGVAGVTPVPPETRRHLAGEVGLSFMAEGGTIVALHVGLVWRHGRGLDFMVDEGVVPEGGLRVRF